ncbi:MULTISPECIES: aminotransferase class V-fold PLP-dependent enzyme [unclassified Solibacillus]|uniref:aminotransferase class V-fold PLP-dependent enzyme n=1 Tax=unclassified Solibacillus TaxID=2637870 RepID=UPI0030FA6852
MYWSKIAATEKEFDAIAALNYETFVEEIPQHQPNPSKRLIDKFHHENVYLIVYKNTEIVGMAAFRDKRPFSIDQKIGNVENHLDPEVCEYLCEIRLLAVKKAHRNGRVFAKLATAIYRYYYDVGYTACVISGTVREEKLYTQMGFKQFAPAVGTQEASYLPMVLTRKDSEVFRERLREQNIVFYPGPVALEHSIEPATISHRSNKFNQELQDMKQQLCKLAHANHVIPLVGTGTLANDAMLGQLKSEFPQEQGLILVNGEFGNRLKNQAKQWGLHVECLDFGWGNEFDMPQIESALEQGNYHYIIFVHGETSNSILNPLEPLLELAKKYRIKLCADCISSFAALPFSMEGLLYATAVSGKALGTIAGLAFVFCRELPCASDAPLYLNLPYYIERQIPFTLPHFYIKAVSDALKAYPERYTVLNKRMELIKSSGLPVKTMYPMIASWQHEKMPLIIQTCELNGFLLHSDSAYLKERNFAQISTIQPNFEKDYKKVMELISYMMETL